MALEWLKTLLGAAYTPEIDTAVAQEIGKGFVARTDFNAKAAKVTELEAEVTQLRGDVKTRDTQLEELKKSAGDNADLKKQIEDLTAQNKADKAAHDKELATVKLMAAVDAELTAAGSKNNTAVKAVLADFLKDASILDGKVTSKVNGESVTLAARVEAMKKDAATDFLFGAAAKYEGWKPGDSGDGKKPGEGKKPSEMSYAELAEYLAANPDAKLD
jgi:alanyl-tRNA synthetase